MKRIACWAIDAGPKYRKALWLALHMFRRLHPAWEMRVYTVEEDAAFERHLLDLGVTVVQRYGTMPPPNPHQNIYIPTARVRCEMIRDISAAGDLMLYMDADGFTAVSMDPLIDEMVAHGQQFAILPEADKRFYTNPAWVGYVEGGIPAKHFPRQAEWQHRPMLNTGVVIAWGEVGTRVGTLACDAYEDSVPVMRFGEQGIVCAAVYDLGVPYREFVPREHCALWERYVFHTGRPYIDASLVDGGQVMFRHFCSYESKVAMRVRVKHLSEHYGLSCP